MRSERDCGNKANPKLKYFLDTNIHWRLSYAMLPDQEIQMPAYTVHFSAEHDIVVWPKWRCSINDKEKDYVVYEVRYCTHTQLPTDPLTLSSMQNIIKIHFNKEEVT